MRSQVLVVDVQQKLVPVIAGHQTVTASVEFLLDVAAVLNVPAVISEQYPEGLGPTLPSIGNHAAVTATFAKLRFSAAEAFLSEQSCPDRDQIVLVGIETHICVLQTAIDLIGQGFQVVVAADAVGSRSPQDHEVALQRLRDAGGIVTTVESVAVEWCEMSGTDEFRQISRLVRARDNGKA